MRILMASHGYPPVISGVTLVTQKLARAMVRRGHEVTIVTGSEKDAPYEDIDHGVRVVRVRTVSNPFWDDGPVPVISKADIESIADELQPQVLHAHDAAVLGLQLQRLGHELEAPVVATSYFVPRFAARYLTWNGEPQPLVESLVWAYSRWLFNRFDHVVFATEAHRRLFIEEGLEAPTSLISNGVALSQYRPLNESGANVDAVYSLPPRPRILFVGRLMQDKEIDVLIGAMKYVWSQQQAHLVIVGRGDYREALIDRATQLDLGHCVHFLGYVPEEDLPALYRAVDLFAIASTCEVQSLPTLQATATGLPVVAANAVALPELVHDGVNGRLVSPGDAAAMAAAMLEVLKNPDLAIEMGAASLAIAKPHDEEKTFSQYEMLYEDLIQHRR